MVLQDQVNVNTAQLPRLLPRFLFKLHVTKLAIAICITILGVICMSIYSMFGFFVLLAAGITSLFAGAFGSLANKLKYMVLHGGSVIVYVLSFYMSYMAYAVCYTVANEVTDTGTNTGSTVVLMICLILLVMDFIVSALNFGVELVAIYVADCQRRLAVEDMRRGAGLP